MVRPQPQRLGPAGRGGAGHAGVATGRTSAGAPGQQCRVEQGGRTGRGLVIDGAGGRHPNQRVPSGASVTAARATTACGPEPNASSPSMTAVRACSAISRSQWPRHTSSGRGDTVIDGSAWRVATSPTRTRSVCSPVRPAGSGMSRSGMASRGVRPRCVYQSRIAGIESGRVEMSSGTAELAHSGAPWQARSSQPSSQLRSVPGHAAAAACSRALISAVRMGASGEHPQCHHVGRRELGDRSGLRLHAHRRGNREQMSHRIGQRRDGPGRSAVANRDSRSEVRPRRRHQ